MEKSRNQPRVIIHTLCWTSEICQAPPRSEHRHGLLTTHMEIVGLLPDRVCACANQHSLRHCPGSLLGKNDPQGCPGTQLCQVTTTNLFTTAMQNTYNLPFLLWKHLSDRLQHSPRIISDTCVWKTWYPRVREAENKPKGDLESIVWVQLGLAAWFWGQSPLYSIIPLLF